MLLCGMRYLCRSVWGVFIRRFSFSPVYVTCTLFERSAYKVCAGAANYVN